MNKLKSLVLGTTRLLVLPALLALFSPLTLMAQDEDADALMEEIIVTGSHIRRTGLTTPTPLQVVTTEDIDLGAEVNIGEFLNQLPSMGAPPISRTNSNFFSDASGIVTIDLRGLGSSRTLTLVNGRRFVAGVPGTSAVDLNTIPTPMIERVEVITGGASAAYGSDAVSGVVNFILKDNFEGVEFSSRWETTDESDGEETDISLLLGGNFDDGRGNVTIYFGYTDQKAVFSRDRTLTAIDAVSPIALGITDDADVDRGGAVFGQVFPFFSSFPPQGRFDVNGTGTSVDDFTFLPDGTLVDSFFTNGNEALGRAPNGFNRMAFRTIAIPTERRLLSTNAHYDFSDNVRLFFEGTYSNTDTKSALEPFPLDSADLFQATNLGGIPVQVVDSNGNLIDNLAIHPTVLAAAKAAGTPEVRFRRRLFEFGGRGATNQRQTFRVVAGLEGTFPGTEMHWDVSYNYGRSTQSQISQGLIDITSFRNALIVEPDPDNPGALRCISAEARETGCAPIDVFGFGAIDQAALDFVSADQSRQSTIEQEIVQLNLTGDIFEMPAGPLQFAVGGEYRLEKSAAINDALTARGLNSSNAIPSVIGSFDVWEGYAELNVPILSDSFVKYFGVGGAVRISDYSTSTVGSTTAWEARFELRPVDQLLIRGSVSRAVRAPNIDDLFDPGGQTFAQVTDPCSGVTATTSGVVADNCRSNPDIAARIARDGAFILTQSELQGTSGFIGGNPNLIEEESDSFTFGGVWTPDFQNSNFNLSLSADWWDIEIDDAIFAVSQNNVLKLCYEDANFPNNPLCGNVTRFGTGNPFAGALDEVNSGAGNVGTISTAGLDVGFNLAYDLGAKGLLSFNTVYTYLDQFEIINLPGSDPDNEKGEIGNAKHRFTTNFRYQRDNLMVQWQLRYIDGSVIEDTDLTAQDCIDLSLNCSVSTVTYSDLSVRYTFPKLVFGSELELFGGVENLFDKDPPIISAGLTDSNTGTETAASVYDPIGRAYYLGLRIRL